MRRVGRPPIGERARQLIAIRLDPRVIDEFRHEQDNPQAPKKTFDYGNAAHKKVLGNGPKLILVDHPAWNTKEAKAEVTAARAQGGIPLKQHEIDMVTMKFKVKNTETMEGKLMEAMFKRLFGGTPKEIGRRSRSALFTFGS